MKFSIFLLITLFFIQHSSYANSQELPTVFKYFQDNDMNDEFHQSSIMNRCAGVVGAYSKYLPISMQSEKERLADVSMTLLNTAVIALDSKQMTDSKSVLEQTEKAFEYYLGEYYSKIEKTQMMTGSIMEGEVRKELDFCLKLVN